MRDVDPETATLGFQDQGDLTGAAGLIFLPREIAAHRFRVVRLLGQGGMAQVFEAEDLELGQEVALKVIRPELAASRRAQELLRREALLARQVTHPNVCRIFDVVQHPGPASATAGQCAASTLVLVMELVRGETLSQRLARGGPLMPAEALPLIRQLAEALHAAHSSHVVHGDFKSGNVILEASAGGPRAVVTDFGLAQRTSMASAYGAGGTTAYMAPEQLRHGELTPASDIYALGVVVHEMVTGARPLPGTAGGTRTGVRPVPPALPASWSRVLGSCLASAPADRPASALAVAELLAAGDRMGEAVAAGPGRNVAGSAARGARRGGAIATTRGVGSRSPARPAMAVLLALGLGLLVASRSAQQGGSAGSRAPGSAEPKPPAPVRLAVAVGSFGDASSRPAEPWLPAALGDLIRLELGAGGQLEAFQLPAGAAGPDHSLAAGDAAAPGQEGHAGHGAGAAVPAAASQERLDADLIVAGSLTTARGAGGATLRIDLGMQRLASGELLASLREVGRREDLPLLAARLGRRLRAVLGVAEPVAEDRSAELALRPKSLQAEGLYALGTALLLRGELVESYAALERALAAEPTFALAHAALARVCVELGYVDRARREAGLAVLPAQRSLEQQRLEIAAIRRRVDGDLAGAAGLFRELWLLAPHHAEYAIQLAESLLEGGKPRDALDTLKLLRARGGDRARSSYLDLIDARARFRISDYHAALAVALAAEEKARAEGNADTLAAAEMEEAAARAAMHDAALAGAALARAGQLCARLGFRGGEAEVLRRSAALADVAGATERALALHRQALAIFEEVGATRGIALVLADTGRIEEQQHNLMRAAALLERAGSEFRRLGDRAGAGRAANDLALVALDNHDDARAEQLFEEAVSLDSEAGDREGLASVLTNMANHEGLSGETGAARMHVEEVLRIAEEMGSQPIAAIAHLNLGCLLAIEGKLHAAGPELLAALRLSRQGNWPYVRANALNALGEDLMHEGRLAMAENALRQGLALDGAGADAAATRRMTRDLVRLRLWQARFRDAEDLARQVLAQDRAARIGPDSIILSLLATAQAGQGRLEEALQSIDQAAAATPPAESEAILVLAVNGARVALAANRPADAVRRVAAALPRFAASPNPDLIFEARLLGSRASVETGHTAACRELRALAQQTHRQRFEHIAREADRLLGNLAGCRAAPSHR